MIWISGLDEHEQAWCRQLVCKVVWGEVGFVTKGGGSVSCLSRRQDSPAINRFGYFALCSDKSLKSNVREGRFVLVHSVKVQ